jgi:hypothetical protein
MSTVNENRNLAAAAATSFFKGNIPDKELESCVNTIKAATGGIPANGSYICAIFYFRPSITINCGGKSWTFFGNAGGLGGIGGGSTNGDVYLADGVTCDELVHNTKSFQFNGALVYFNINFFDANSKFLGSFHGGGVGTCPGTGGGTGSWS